MPIYEYKCPSCSKKFEEWVKNSEESEQAVCPDCDVSSPRVLSATTFILKGCGWYSTDYGKMSKDSDFNKETVETLGHG